MSSTPPSAPRITLAPRSSNQTLEFKWAAPLDPGTIAGNPATITTYRMELRDTGGGLAYSHTVDGSIFYHKITGLTNGITYILYIDASNDNGVTYGPVASFRPFQAGNGVPLAPATVSVTPGGGNAYATVSWTAPSSLPDSTIFWYSIVSVSTNPSDPVIKRTANGLTQTSLYIPGLNPASSYRFSIRAVNCPGYGPPELTTQFGPTPQSTTDYVTDSVQNIGPDTNVTELTTFLSGWTAENPAPVDTVTEPSVLITTFVGTAAPGFDADTTYETTFVLLTDNVATVDTTALTSNSVLYFPMSPGTPISFVTPSATYSITTSSNTITIDGTTYNLGDYVTLGGTSFQVAFTGSAGLLVATPPPPPVTDMTDLGVLSGGTSSVATAVSSDGSIITGYGTISGGGTRMFTYQSGTMTQVDTSSYPTTNFFALGISGDGSILVGYSQASGSTSAFKYSSSSITTLNTLPSGSYAIAKAISSDGTVIVGISEESGVERAVAYYSSGTTPTNLDPYYDYAYSQATAASSDGSIVVGHGFSNNSGLMEAFYVSGGSLTAFGYIIGGYYTYATGVSADGTKIVGYFNDSDSSPSYQEGYIYNVGINSSQINAAANIPAYAAAGLNFTTITGISADGSTVVGYASSGINSSDARAFKYTVSGAVYTDLGTLSGYPTIAKAVSSDGSVIVGQSQTVSSATHAFKYQLPPGFVYSDQTNTVVIGYNGAIPNPLVVPEGVLEIGNNAFLGRTTLVSITFPTTLTNIGTSAFQGCTGLTSITIPDTVTSISNNTFQNCTGLASITLPNTLTSIGSYVFDGCTSVSTITIPDSVTFLGSRVFQSCSGLTSITLPSSLTSISEGVFYGCTSLSSFTVPSSVTSIDGFVFYGCSGLTSVTIPNAVTSIGVYAFNDCSQLSSITLPSNLTTLADGIFKGCGSLTSFTIPSTITTIGYEAFWGCTGLTSITIPSTVTSLGDNVFILCTSLTSITFQASVTNIGFYLFNTCTSLTSFTVPSNITLINAGAFGDCSNLATVVFPTSSAITIQSYSFTGTAITSVTVKTGSTIQDNAFPPGCTINYV